MTIKEFRNKLIKDLNRMPEDFLDKELVLKGQGLQWYQINDVNLANLIALENCPELKNALEILVTPGNPIYPHAMYIHKLGYDNLVNASEFEKNIEKYMSWKQGSDKVPDSEKESMSDGEYKSILVRMSGKDINM